MLIKPKKQNFASLKESLPDLYTTINVSLPNMSSEEKGIVAGLCIEYIIQSGGDVDILQDDLSKENIDEDFDEIGL